jgi:predicted dehydrogenase/threonine dehydrogenase-like Zn-dependent dehydrogenase
MLQVAISGGEVRVVDVPAPVSRPGFVVVQTSHSLISAGTEGAGITGRSESLAVKAIKNPDLVRKVIQRVRTHGLKQTTDLVRSRIGSELPIGYSAAGVVVEVGEGVSQFRPGDRVACAGAGYANHAEYNAVPVNLTVPVPANVDLQEAAFATLGAIALQGIRRAEPTMGESVVVIGLGLLGQLTTQMLAAAGVRTIGVDMLPERVERAKQLGMEDGFAIGERDLSEGVLERTSGIGADAVIVCAAGSDPGLLNQAFDLCRRRGRVILVGDVPIRVQRDKIYRKELDFRISTSYGPGRYDKSYEEGGQDYPIGYVRWTEGRNLAEVLRLISRGKLKVKPLIDAVFPVADALSGYIALKSERRPIGVLLEYDLPPATGIPRFERVRVNPSKRDTKPSKRQYQFGVIGFGGYFSGMLLPLLEAHPGFAPHSVCSRSGLAVRNAQSRHGFPKGFTNWEDAVNDPDVDLLFIATRHDQHYRIARAAIDAGKHVFVEKPMTMTSAEGADLITRVDQSTVLLTVGFNRRFSPHAAELARNLREIAEPLTVLYRVNAGWLPPDHWLNDPVEGGGRILGEGVHFFDFFRFLTKSEPISVTGAPIRGARPSENVSALVTFEDGSTGALVYTAQGGSGLSKERVEVHAGRNSYVLDDFRELQVFGSGNRVRTSKTDKGQANQLENLYCALVGKEELGVTVTDGYWATWCAEQALIPR